jgi:retron-type reverse transcriptase
MYKAKIMKRFGNLFDKVISIANLQLAADKAMRGKSRQPGVKMFLVYRDANIVQLHQDLADGTFKTSKYTVFKVYEPKERDIYRLPFYPDRIVHHAIMNVIEPILYSVFTYNTYSSIKNRGITACADRVSKIIKSFEGKPLYCLKIDIKKYYPSIDNAILKEIVRRKIKDVKLLSLIDGIIDSEKGLPIGNYISQSLANLYLAYFMHYCNEELRIKCTEYADDIVFFDSDKDMLHIVFAAINNYLATYLHLTIKSNYQIFPIAVNRYDKKGRALDYVGFQFYRYQRLMRKRIKKNFCRHLSLLRRHHVAGHRLKSAVAPWLGWAQHSQSRNLLNKILPEYAQNIL